MGQEAQQSCILGSLVLSIPLLNSLFCDAFKNWQLAVHAKTILFSTLTYFFGLPLQWHF